MIARLTYLDLSLSDRAPSATQRPRTRMSGFACTRGLGP
jgi:hypothetical protein